MLYSVADGDYEKWSKPQLERFLIGFVIMLIMGCVGIDFWRACSPFVYFFGVLLLISVFFFGDYGGGAKRWLEFGSFRFQPSEIMKVGLVMFLAIYYDWLKPANTSKIFWVIIPIIIIILPTVSFSEIYISKIYNKVNVLNLHGNRFFLNEETEIKSGDYLSTREKPATIIFQDNTKLCFSSNSSLKILKNKNKINFEFTKGSILFSINKKSYEHYNLNFFSYNLEDIKDIIILTKKNNLEIINFKKNMNILYKDNINSINLPSFTILELSNNGKVFKTTKILETNKFSKNFLEDCVIKLPKTNKIENKNFKLQYGCISQNGKLVCGNKYK